MKDLITRLDQIQYFTPHRDASSGGSTATAERSSFGKNLTDDQIQEKLTLYGIDLGKIDLSSKRDKGLAMARIIQHERNLARPQEVAVVTPPLQEQVSGRIQTKDDQHAVDAYTEVWAHLRHSATNAKPNGHFQEANFSLTIPSYPLEKIDALAIRTDALIIGNISGEGGVTTATS